MKKSVDERLDPEWYYKHRDELDNRAAEAMRSGRAKPLTAEMVEARLKASRVKSKETRPVTVRLAVADIELAKVKADKMGLGYQTYLKSLIHQALTQS